MYLKYFIKTQERPIGLKYNPMKLLMVIGGHASLIDDITAVTKDFFNISLAEKKVVRTIMSNNKVRFQCRVSYEVFRLGMQKLQDSGISISKTKELGRIMR